MRSYWKSNDIKDCCGCAACVNACPQGCINMKKDEEGFLHPIKDMSMCIDCGLCEKV
jgi:formate hydrogenlyase subunit 6/NADH:ubiquinone oxidoreductase subunit I